MSPKHLHIREVGRLKKKRKKKEGVGRTIRSEGGILKGLPERFWVKCVPVS